MKLTSIFKIKPHLAGACLFVFATLTARLATVQAGDAQPALEVGIAVRDITPEGPIWLAGYAARNRASEKVDSPLLAEAVAFRSPPADPLVLISVDNCEVSRHFTTPVLESLSRTHGLGPGRVIIVSSHTHSGPVLDGPLMGMYPLTPVEQERIAKYGRFLQEKLIEVAAAALSDFEPATLEHGIGEAHFAMNRRVYQDDKVVFGENPDGPVDWDVPVLRIKGPTGDLRAILFGYACHGTSIAGPDFYTVSGDYMAYARQQLETLYPGAVAVYLTGMGADANPSPRGRLIDAKRHGLELAGAVAGVLDRPMRSVAGKLTFAHTEVELPLMPAPTREQMETDARSQDGPVKQRALAYLAALDRGEHPADFIKLPLAAWRIGDDLMFLAMGGEVVVDYGTRLKRLCRPDRPWLIGYAYEVPSYIPSIRLLKEGGYEADSSLIYYGIYGPYRTRIEDILINGMMSLVRQVRQR
jgi:hypothetical protein